MEKGLKTAQRALCAMALCAVYLLFAALAACDLFLTANLTTTAQMSETVTLVRDALLPGLLLTLAMLAALALFHGALIRFARVRLTGALAALWLAGALVLAFGVQMRQMYDFAAVIEGAELFAQGNYKAMAVDYFNASSYQLGFCLPMEFIKRVFPAIDLNLFMQAVNAVCSVAAAGALAALCELLAGRRARFAACALYLTCLPALFYCAFVYATLPMALLCSCAFLCFALYLRGRRAGFALAGGACVAVAAMLKPNAYIPIAALVICALVDFLTSRDWRLLLIMALTAALAALLARAAIWQYELRSGTALIEDISMLARLTMGLQRDGAQAGWYNRYIEQFYPLDVTRAQELAVARADLQARLAELAQDPAMLGAFLRDKALTQWIEPTFGTLWYGHLSGQAGPLAGAAEAIYAQGGALRAAIEGYMDVWQQAVYLLAAIGTAVTLRRRGGAQELILPVTIIGGFLYHMIFEAKAQYIFVYALYLIPLAAQGLCALEDAARRAWRGVKGGK